jgi:hypothetical protein
MRTALRFFFAGSVSTPPRVVPVEKNTQLVQDFIGIHGAMAIGADILH